MDVLDSGDGELETIDQGRSGDPSFLAGNRKRFKAAVKD